MSANGYFSTYYTLPRSTILYGHIKWEIVRTPAIVNNLSRCRLNVLQVTIPRIS